MCKTARKEILYQQFIAFSVSDDGQIKEIPLQLNFTDHYDLSIYVELRKYTDEDGVEESLCSIHDIDKNVLTFDVSTVNYRAIRYAIQQFDQARDEAISYIKAQLAQKQKVEATE